MDSSLIAITVPGSQNIPLHSTKKTSSFFKGEIDDKGSTILRIARYIIMTVGTLLPAAVNLATVTSLEKSLNNGGSFETLFSGDSTGENLIKGLEEIQQISQHPTSTVDKIARTLLLQSAYALEKADSLLYAIDNLGVPNDLAANTLYGVGYLASLGLAFKHLLEVTESVKDVESEVEKQQLSLLKKAKFGASAGAAIVGFFTLIYTSTSLAIASICLALGTAILSVADYFYENSLKKENPGEKFEKYHLAIPKFQMV